MKLLRAGLPYGWAGPAAVMAVVERGRGAPLVAVEMESELGEGLWGGGGGHH
jgi:hypothetical protein